MMFDKIRNNHLMLMILSCALPIAAVLTLSYLGIIGSWGYYALFLLCPLGHVLILKHAHADQGNQAGNSGNKSCH